MLLEIGEFFFACDAETLTGDWPGILGWEISGHPWYSQPWLLFVRVGKLRVTLSPAKSTINVTFEYRKVTVSDSLPTLDIFSQSDD